MLYLSIIWTIGRILMVWGTAVVGMLTIGIVLIKTEASAGRGGNGTGGTSRRRQFGGLGMGGGNGQISYASHVDLSEEQLAVRLQLVNRCTEDITHRLPTWLDADRRRMEREEEEEEEMTCSLCFDPMWCHQGNGSGGGDGGGDGGGGGGGDGDGDGNGPPTTTTSLPWDWLANIRLVASTTTVSDEGGGEDTAITRRQLPVSELSCGHQFHRDCVNKWLVDKYRNDCPLCRAIVVDPSVVVRGVD